MRTTVARRAALTASAAALALLVTVCGGGDEKGGGEAVKGDAAAGAPAAKALTAAELERLVIAPAGLEDHKVAEPGKDDVSDPGTLSAEQAECEEEKLAAGEGAVAWTVGTELDGTPADTKVVVFRQGVTLAGFSSFDIAAVGRGEAFEQPTAVIEAQEAKLG